MTVPLVGPELTYNNEARGDALPVPAAIFDSTPVVAAVLLRHGPEGEDQLLGLAGDQLTLLSVFHVSQRFALVVPPPAPILLRGFIPAGVVAGDFGRVAGWHLDKCVSGQSWEVFCRKIPIKLYTRYTISYSVQFQKNCLERAIKENVLVTLQVLLQATLPVSPSAWVELLVSLHFLSQ